MAFVEVNLNPCGRDVGDCVIRALCLVTGQDWESVYTQLAYQGLLMCDMMNANEVWGAYLRGMGYVRKTIPDYCPDCYTIREFAEDHPHGVYVVATGSHVVPVIFGDYYDTSDSGSSIPTYYMERR